jgi:hypothetical protein
LRFSFSPREIRQWFLQLSWLDFILKVNIGIVDDALNELESILDASPYIQLNLYDGDGIDKLQTEVL